MKYTKTCQWYTNRLHRGVSLGFTDERHDEFLRAASASEIIRHFPCRPTAVQATPCCVGLRFVRHASATCLFHSLQRSNCAFIFLNGQRASSFIYPTHELRTLASPTLQFEGNPFVFNKITIYEKRNKPGGEVKMSSLHFFAAGTMVSSFMWQRY